MEFAYDLVIDPEVENNTHTHTCALEMIGHNKRVLELGCATGSFTKSLAEGSWVRTSASYRLRALARRLFALLRGGSQA